MHTPPKCPRMHITAAHKWGACLPASTSATLRKCCTAQVLCCLPACQPACLAATHPPTHLWRKGVEFVKEEQGGGGGGCPAEDVSHRRLRGADVLIQQLGPAAGRGRGRGGKAEPGRQGLAGGAAVAV